MRFEDLLLGDHYPCIDIDKWEKYHLDRLRVVRNCFDRLVLNSPLLLVNPDVPADIVNLTFVIASSIEWSRKDLRLLDVLAEPADMHQHCGIGVFDLSRRCELSDRPITCFGLVLPTPLAWSATPPIWKNITAEKSAQLLFGHEAVRQILNDTGRIDRMQFVLASRT